MLPSELKHDTVLTELCAICHVNPIKYTCPGCSIHTCSLPCVKKHKRWAQCSGVRNPAEYRKRAELATPSSIDKDFNFITKVERSVQHADRTNLDRGIDLVPSRTKSHNAGSQPKWVQEAEARNLSIIKAPKGLSRNKANKTHWVGHLKCILWTVEWISPEGDIRLSGAHDTKTIDEAYSIAFGKRKQLKRKRETVKDNEHHNASSNANSSILEKRPLPDSPILTTSPEVSIHNYRDVQQEQHGQTQDLEQNALVSSSLTSAEEKHIVNGPQSCRSEGVSTTGLFFYLHRPRTEARYKCLVPLDPQQTMQEILRDRVILEYPTIHVRMEPPTDLPTPFILEQEYLDRYGVDIPINVAVPSNTQSTYENAEEGELMQAEEETSVALSGSKVIEVLAKDLNAE